MQFQPRPLALKIGDTAGTLDLRKFEIKELRPEGGLWVPLFNGKDLGGWETFDKSPGRWKVVDGIITCDGPPSWLFTRRDDFKDFHFRIEARTSTGGNSGQYFRCQFGPGQPKGYFAQINNSDPGRSGAHRQPDALPSWPLGPT